MKLKKLFVTIVAALLCAMCAFTIVSCVENGGKNDPKPTYYTVTFYHNMALDEEFFTASVESGKTAADKVPGTMIRQGYTFETWCTDKELTQDFDIDNTPITSDISLYAHWKKDHDRAWFLETLGECAANANKDSVAWTNVSYKIKLNGGDRVEASSEIVNGAITAGDYTIRVNITAEWFENEILKGEGITLSSEYYTINSVGDFHATVRFANAENQKYIYSFVVNKYGYMTGGSLRIDNGSGEATTTLYIFASANYS